jgi:3-hydroxyisobutyrate dehydrogenase-like beta-hydroxyacid dehydrogenase
MATVVILHPGDMGAAVGAALTKLGHEVGWLPAHRGPATRRRAERAGLHERESVHGCDLVISICPPAAAVTTAESIGDFAGVYVDANAISPDTANDVAAIVRRHGADYVDGGVIGAPPTREGTTRLYLSGDRAPDVAAWFGGALIEPRVLLGPPFAASGLKMAYAAWTKVSAALLLAARETASALGVEAALAEEWALSQPRLEQRYDAALVSAADKGWRWEEEMRQIARTFAAAGQPGEFGDAAATIYSRHPRPAQK